MARFASKKNPFDAISDDVKDEISAMDEAAIRAKVCQVALAENDNRSAMKADEDLAQKKEIAKEAGAQYAEATKANKLLIGYCRYMLDAKGKL